ncbi:hypothetical protein O7599_23900 [Streptomyces sp. WMMC500]|uniref:hypothetical protein n=1 Tax=Streptomyces sp. WMMC500 TaxID=3015154 RepID=UPI00248B8E00|nr:hypothetical protein [Streptomyces sp. WMMC500]WBB58655.1 hypothetical protein O7599_23900 [Streptomyces sp. WMMC500]
MAEQTPVTAKPKPAAKGTPVTPPRSTGGFAPQVSTYPVPALTLGRQTFNDSDKDNYFEG